LRPSFRHLIDERTAVDVTARKEGLVEPMIRARGLRKTFPGGVEAVKRGDLDVPPGEGVGLLGPNRAGKSDTVGMLTTTMLPSGGTATVAGFDVAKAPLAARAASSVVFQEPVVDRSLTGRRNLEIHARLWQVDPREARARIGELGDALGIGELLDRPAGTYSGGEEPRPQRAHAPASHTRGECVVEADGRLPPPASSPVAPPSRGSARRS